MRFQWRKDGAALRLDYAGETLATVRRARWDRNRWTAAVQDSPTSTRLFHLHTKEAARLKAQEYMLKLGIWPPRQPDLFPRS